jgi:hypothetical protein
MTDKPTPADAQLQILFTQLMASGLHSPDAKSASEFHQDVLHKIQKMALPENWALLHYEPSKTLRRRRWRTAKKFTKLKDAILTEGQSGGAEVFDEKSLFKLEVLKTKLHFGMWLDRSTRKRLQLAVDEKKATEKEVHDSLWSWGGLTTPEGRLFANPCSRAAQIILGLLLATVGAFAAWCVLVMAGEILQSQCRPCVLVGGCTLLLLSAQVADVLYQFGPKRQKCAIILIKAGIPTIADCPVTGRRGWLRFMHWGEPPYQSI